jgi:hypothetical protein
MFEMELAVEKLKGINRLVLTKLIFSSSKKVIQLMLFGTRKNLHIGKKSVIIDFRLSRWLVIDVNTVHGLLLS